MKSILLSLFLLCTALASTCLVLNKKLNEAEVQVGALSDRFQKLECEATDGQGHGRTAYPAIRRKSLATSAEDAVLADMHKPVTAGMKDPMKDANVAAMVRAVDRRTLQLDYGDFIRQLTLSIDQAEMVFQVLGRQREEIRLNARDHDDDDGGLNAVNAETRAQRDLALLELLGDGAFAQFQEYEKYMVERTEVKNLALTFYAANVPLDDQRKRKFLAILIEEKTSLPPPDGTDGLTDWQAEYDQRVRDRAEGALTPEQLKVLDDSRNLQSIVMRTQTDR